MEYEVLDAGGGVIARETADERPQGDGVSVSCRLGRAGPEDRADWELALRVSASGAVEGLTVSTGGMAEAEYAWRGEDWVGRVGRPGEPGAPAVWPMASGVHNLSPAAASDALLLRRAGLREGSQARLETLDLDTRTLQFEPSHRLVDHLGWRRRMFPVGLRRAARYRVVDSAGAEAELWLGEDGTLLERRAADGRRWRLVPPGFRLDKEELLERSKVFCMYPWTHLYVHPDGRALPCCVSDEHTGLIGTLRKSTIEELWDSEPMRGIRRDMLAGRKVASCARCYQMEQVGLASPRRSQNETFEHHFALVDETRPDGSAGPVNMAYFDVRFSNLCNFKCRTCGPTSSSAWHADYAALGRPLDHESLVTPTGDPEGLWRQIEPFLDSVESVYFAGGEPLIMDEHYRVLEALLARGKEDVRLCYSTNFSVMTHQGWDPILLWDRFRSVEIYASLDGMGKQGEYLRSGQEWGRVLRNRERLKTVAPRTKFFVKPVLTCMNALHLPEFHRRWLDEGLIDVGRLHLTVAEDPEEYVLQVLPHALKRRVEEAYERHISEALRPRGAALEEGLFRSAIAYMRERDRSELLPKFRARTRALDTLRGERFEDVFPELAELMAE